MLWPYLMMPYVADPPRAHNKIQCDASVDMRVEHEIEMLKMGFQCFHLSGWCLMRTTEKVAKPFMVYAMLYNMALQGNKLLLAKLMGAQRP